MGQDYPIDEKREACDALDAGLAALNASSAATGGAPTEDRVPSKHTLGVMLAEKLTEEFYTDLKKGKLWEDRDERQKLRKNLRVMFRGFEVTTPEELHSGKYAERAAVELDTGMLRQNASMLTECYKDQFELGTDADAMCAAVTRAARNVLPQMWLEAYDAVRPCPTPCVHSEEKHDARVPLGDRCTGCMTHVCRAAARRGHSGAKVGPLQRGQVARCRHTELRQTEFSKTGVTMTAAPMTTTKVKEKKSRA